MENLRKRALLAAFGRALQWRKISILVDPKQVWVLLKSEHFLCPSSVVPLDPSTRFAFFGGSTDLFVGVHYEQYFKGGALCQQLLTLLTLKSATCTVKELNVRNGCFQ